MLTPLGTEPVMSICHGNHIPRPCKSQGLRKVVATILSLGHNWDSLRLVWFVPRVSICFLNSESSKVGAVFSPKINHHERVIPKRSGPVSGTVVSLIYPSLRPSIYLLCVYACVRITLCMYLCIHPCTRTHARRYVCTYVCMYSKCSVIFYGQVIEYLQARGLRKWLRS